jgi:hypothetical protein
MASGTAVAVTVRHVGTENMLVACSLILRVSLLEALPRIVPAEDPDVGEAPAGYQRDEGKDVQAVLLRRPAVS